MTPNIQYSPTDIDMINTMALAISTPTQSLLQSSTPYIGTRKPLIPISKYATPQLGFNPFSGANQQLGIISIPKFSARMRRKGKKGKKGKHGGVYASLFGVGAPEALVIGVVALLVFGPKGLAEAARSLGKTIRSFQPTIKELQEVSREFKSSLQREIGLDEINNPASERFSSNTPKPTLDDIAGTDMEPPTSESLQESPASDGSGAYTADEYLKLTEKQLQEALARLQKEQKEQQDEKMLSNQSQQETPSEDTPQVPPKPTNEV